MAGDYLVLVRREEDSSRFIQRFGHWSCRVVCPSLLGKRENIRHTCIRHSAGLKYKITKLHNMRGL